jgi:medium-chain acyl-[acyl-carrier-protein] hydrolase
MADHLTQIQTNTVNRWFYIPKANPAAKIRLFCFPYAGGSAAIFKDWGKTLGPDVELLAIQLPGRGARLGEPPIRSISAIVSNLAMAMIPLLDRPYAFFGHSNGALISYELAKELRRQNETGPEHMIVSAKRAAQLPRLGPITYDMPQDQFIQVLREYEGTPREILDDKELLTFLLPTIRADFCMSDTYQFRPSAALDCDLTLFGSLNDRYVPFNDLLAWTNNVSGTVTHKIFGGGHFFLHSHGSDVISSVEQVLMQILDRVER